MIAAIETTYRGMTFRSRLEARWAVFFSTLGLQYQYEPERFSLPQITEQQVDDAAEIDVEPTDILYTPDFLLPKQEKLPEAMWVECKGVLQPIDELAMLRLCMHTGIRGIIVKDIPRLPENVLQWKYTTCDRESWAGSLEWSSPYPYSGDIGHFFCQCPHCGAFGFEFWCRAERIKCCDSSLNTHKNYHMGDMIPNALARAASYKFEYQQ
jgi:hypothetical protein